MSKINNELLRLHRKLKKKYDLKYGNEITWGTWQPRAWLPINSFFLRVEDSGVSLHIFFDKTDHTFGLKEFEEGIKAGTIHIREPEHE